MVLDSDFMAQHIECQGKQYVVRKRIRDNAALVDCTPENKELVRQVKEVMEREFHLQEAKRAVARKAVHRK